jgi:hypothetical protein
MSRGLTEQGVIYDDGIRGPPGQVLEEESWGPQRDVAPSPHQTPTGPMPTPCLTHTGPTPARIHAVQENARGGA